LGYAGECSKINAREDLIANKRASARLQDLADVEKLESVSVQKTKIP
jgi:hypothetical protein